MGFRSSLKSSMRQTCSVGPKSRKKLLNPTSWLNNSDIVKDLRDSMVTCHRVDQDNMESIYELMSDDLNHAAAASLPQRS